MIKFKDFNGKTKQNKVFDLLLYYHYSIHKIKCGLPKFEIQVLGTNLKLTFTFLKLVVWVFHVQKLLKKMQQMLEGKVPFQENFLKNK